MPSTNSKNYQDVQLSNFPKAHNCFSVPLQLQDPQYQPLYCFDYYENSPFLLLPAGKYNWHQQPTPLFIVIVDSASAMMGSAIPGIPLLAAQGRSASRRNIRLQSQVSPAQRTFFMDGQHTKSMPSSCPCDLSNSLSRLKTMRIICFLRHGLSERYIQSCFPINTAQPSTKKNKNNGKMLYLTAIAKNHSIRLQRHHPTCVEMQRSHHQLVGRNEHRGFCTDNEGFATSDTQQGEA